jgi:hypothetical protein
VIDHQKMIANFVECILVAARQQGGGVGDRGSVPVEHAITQLLGTLHVALSVGKPHLESTQPPKRGGQIRKISDRLDDARRGGLRLEPGYRRLCCGPDILRPQHLDQALRRSRKFAVLHVVPRDRMCSESNQRGLRESEITGIQRPCDTAIAGA